MSSEHLIPAAHIRDMDAIAIALVDPAAAVEITRIGELMERGEETSDEFLRLIRLLHQVGYTEKSEHLLRRNLEVGEAAYSLYLELYGTEKADEYSGAINAFAEQFSVDLKLHKSRGFLDCTYHTQPRPASTDLIGLLNMPCEVRFNYAHPTFVEADVCSLKTDDYLILRWVSGAWSIIGPQRDCPTEQGLHGHDE